METDFDDTQSSANPVKARDSVLRGLMPVVAALALLGIGVGVFAVTKVPSTSRTDRELRLLSHRLAQADAQIAALKTASTHTANQGNVAALQADVGNLRVTVARDDSKLHQYGICVPELMTYVNGLTPSYSYVTDGNGDRLATDPITISSGSQISSNCTKLLYGG